MNALVKLAAAGLIGGSLMVIGAVSQASAEKKAIAKYKLNADQTVFVKTCKSALASSKKAFKKTNANEGCACVAGHFGPTLRKGEYGFAAEVFTAVLALHSSRDSKMFGHEIDDATRRANLSRARAGDILAVFNGAAKQCLRG
jgi:hypothetical protein